MTVKLAIEYFIGITLVTFLFAFADACARPVHWKHRFQMALENDNNIYESPSFHTTGQAIRGMYQLNMKGSPADTRIIGQLTVGYQGYKKYLNEDKWITELQLQASHWMISGIGTGGEVHTRWKSFVYNQTRYRILSGSAYLFGRLSYAIQWSAGVRIHTLNYDTYFEYDYDGREHYLSVKKSFHHGWEIDLRYAYHLFQFRRPAFHRPGSHFEVIPTGTQQQDHLYRISAFIRYTGAVLWQFGYQTESNSSNSYGFSYQQMTFISAFSSRLPAGWLLRAQGMLRNKHYTQSLGPDIPDALDAEDKNSNFLLIDLSHRISDTGRVFVRVGIYYNESPYRARYYRKTLLTFGTDFAF